MYFHKVDSTLRLVALSDLKGATPQLPLEDLKAMRETVRWAKEYLCEPHPDLGRKGPVCPFVQTSMEQGLFLMAICRYSPLSIEKASSILMKYRDWFLEITPRSGSEAQYKSILVLFPVESAEDIWNIIDATQAKLKPEYVSRGLMIGEFHPGPPRRPGLWNPDFRPLFSPIPMLAIRHMVPTDFPFLKDDPRFVAAYCDRFGRNVPPHLQQQVNAAATRFGVTF